MSAQPLQIYDTAAEAARRDPSGMMVRALVPYDTALGFELFAIDLHPGALSESAAHAPNVVEHVTILEGDLSVRVADRWHALKAGQTLRFAADVAHAYHNPGGDIARVHDLIHYLRVAD